MMYECLDVIIIYNWNPVRIVQSVAEQHAECSQRTLISVNPRWFTLFFK